MSQSDHNPLTELQSLKNDLNQIQLVQSAIPQINDGEILLKVDRFAFTSNNITYGVTGDTLGYWQFFQPHENIEPRENAEPHEIGDAAIAEWGLLPVWGFADVIESGAPDIPIGDRIFGYFPPATYAVMKPVHVTPSSYIEGAEHRAALPPGYNRYSRTAGEAGYNPAMDDLRMLLFPLHITSFCLHDFLSDADFYGAEQVIIVSASSKTSLGLAYALHTDDTAPSVIAMTSARNLSFVNSIGYYDQAVAYDDIAAMQNIPTAIVDMSGNADIINALKDHLGDNMKHIINVGFTHWDSNTPDSNTADNNTQNSNTASDPSARSTSFFAPSHIQKRIKDWGAQEFGKRSTRFIMKSTMASQSWLNVKRISGINGMAGIYQNVCEGNIPANEGIVIEL